MKKTLQIFACIAIVAMVFANPVSAQKTHLGVKGGLNYTSFNDLNLTSTTALTESIKNYGGFNIGLALQIELPMGFAVQPEVLYSQIGSSIEMPSTGTILDAVLGGKTMSLVQGVLEVPVNIQWGIKLGPIKPFVQFSPYVTYALSNGLKFKDGTSVNETLFNSDNMKKFNYGVGLGAGIQVWKVQISGRYKWGLGTVADAQATGLPAVNQMFDKSKISGFELAAAFLF